MTVSPEEFEFLRNLCRDISGLALHPGKEYLIEARLLPVAREEGLGSVSELVSRLRLGDARLRVTAVEAMATHETYFFRDVHPFEALRTDIIPAVLARNDHARLSIWSAASSTGQEAFSIAMLIKEHFPRIKNVTILATDFSAEVLSVASAGIFTQMEVNRGLPAPLLVKYFERRGRSWQIAESIRSMVTFQQLNLIEPFPALPSMDIVFLRNVLTYFDPDLKSSVLRKCATTLRPGSYLFLGGAETIYGLDVKCDIVRVGRSVCYQYSASD